MTIAGTDIASPAARVILDSTFSVMLSSKPVHV